MSENNGVVVADPKVNGKAKTKVDTQPVSETNVPTWKEYATEKYEQAKTWFMSLPNWGKATIIVLALFLLYKGYSWWTSPITSNGIPLVAGSNGSSGQASGPGTMTITVQSVGRVGNRAFLNSMPSYKDAGNQVVVLEGAALQVDVNGLRGKTVTANGMTGNYKGQPQLVVNNPASLSIK